MNTSIRDKIDQNPWIAITVACTFVITLIVPVLEWAHRIRMAREASKYETTISELKIKVASLEYEITQLTKGPKTINALPPDQSPGPDAPSPPVVEGGSQKPLPIDMPTPPVLKLGPVATHELKGVTYELMGCTKETRLVTCHLILTNNGSDRNLAIYISWGNISSSFIYDQRGHRFNSSRITMADVDASGTIATKFLVTEIPTSTRIFFEGVPSAIEFINILHIHTKDGGLEFRNVQFSD